MCIRFPWGAVYFGRMGFLKNLPLPLSMPSKLLLMHSIYFLICEGIWPVVPMNSQSGFNSQINCLLCPSFQIACPNPLGCKWVTWQRNNLPFLVKISLLALPMGLHHLKGVTVIVTSDIIRTSKGLVNHMSTWFTRVDHL